MQSTVLVLSRETSFCPVFQHGIAISLQPDARVGIGQIYASFDATSTAVFHRAMSVSHGGVVRVQDLRVALLELSDDVAAAQVPAVWRTAGHSDCSRSQCVRPATNEPALREILESAFRLAMRLGERSLPQITTRVLWAAALSRDSIGSSDAFTIYGQLPRASTGSTTQRSPSVFRNTSIQKLTSEITEASEAHSDNNIAVILQKWLTLQSMTDDRSRHSIRVELAQLTAAFDDDADEGGTG